MTVKRISTHPKNLCLFKIAHFSAHAQRLGQEVSEKRGRLSLQGCEQFRGPRFCHQAVVNFLPFGESAMNITGLGTDLLRVKLRIMSDDDLWWLFLDHREKCLQEFWGEVETRKAAGKLTCHSLVQQYLDRIKAYDQGAPGTND